MQSQNASVLQPPLRACCHGLVGCVSSGSRIAIGGANHQRPAATEAPVLGRRGRAGSRSGGGVEKVLEMFEAWRGTSQELMRPCEKIKGCSPNTRSSEWFGLFMRRTKNVELQLTSGMISKPSLVISKRQMCQHWTLERPALDRPALRALDWGLTSLVLLRRRWPWLVPLRLLQDLKTKRSITPSRRLTSALALPGWRPRASRTASRTRFFFGGLAKAKELEDTQKQSWMVGEKSN